jgi:hypothetical protein
MNSEKSGAMNTAGGATGQQGVGDGGGDDRNTETPHEPVRDLGKNGRNEPIMTGWPFAIAEKNNGWGREGLRAMHSITAVLQHKEAVSR